MVLTSSRRRDWERLQERTRAASAFLMILLVPALLTLVGFYPPQALWVIFRPCRTHCPVVVRIFFWALLSSVLTPTTYDRKQGRRVSLYQTETLFLSSVVGILSATLPTSSAGRPSAPRTLAGLGAMAEEHILKGKLTSSSVRWGLWRVKRVAGGLAAIVMDGAGMGANWMWESWEPWG